MLGVGLLRSLTLSRSSPLSGSLPLCRFSRDMLSCREPSDANTVPDRGSDCGERGTTSASSSESSRSLPAPELQMLSSSEPLARSQSLGEGRQQMMAAYQQLC
jgi:hypothetical protein